MAVNSGLNLLGSQFVEVGTEAALDINDLVTPSADLAGMTDSYEFQTFLMTWDGANYVTYGYCGEGQGEGLFGDPSWNAKWISVNMDALAIVDISAGTGFWVQTSGDSTVTMMGQVASAESTSVDVTAGLNLISSSYPKAINVQDVVISSDIPGMTDGYEFQTFLMTWDGANYVTYGYCGEGQGESLFGDPSWNAKWISVNMDGVADATLPAGSGFWVQTTGTGTVTFAK